MSFYDLVKQNRSCRRFDHSHRLETKTLRGLVDLARLSASAGNMQPLKYVISVNEEKNAEIYSCLKWAAYLTDWEGPQPSERPAGYITVLGDQSISKNYWCDHGIASQTILLGARDMGLAGCIFGAINKPRLGKILGLPDHLEILLVIALGKPVEENVIEELPENGDIQYYRDENAVHHVPKRALDDIITFSF